MKIVFFGTPEFAAHILQSLVTEAYDIVGVVTTPDRPTSRGRKLRPSAVKEMALAELPEVPILQPEKLRDEHFLTELKSLQADLFVVVAFRMLPKEVWAMPSRGSFNLHASLLPKFRGAAPIQHAILSGESVTGVTTFLLDKDIDTGRILLQVEVPITQDDTGGTLHDKLMIRGAQLVAETIDYLANKPESADLGTPQPEVENLPLAPKIFKEDRHLSFATQSADQLLLRVRALSPYPAAYAQQVEPQEQEIKILSAAVIPSILNAQPGELHLIREGKSLAIQCSEGALELIEIQMPSKRATPVQDFLNGNTPPEGALFL